MKSPAQIRPVQLVLPLDLAEPDVLWRRYRAVRKTKKAPAEQFDFAGFDIPYRLWPDESLAKVCRVDDQAWHELVRRYSRPIFRTGDDSVNYVVAMIRHRCSKYRPRPGARFSTWFLKVIANLGRDARRKDRPKRDHAEFCPDDEAFAVDLAPVFREVEIEVIMAGLSPEARSMAEQILSGCVVSLENPPEELRAAFVYLIDGYGSGL